MTNSIQIGAWLPTEWGRQLTGDEQALIADSDIDLLLIPENHDQWEHRDEWKTLANELGVAMYVGLSDGDWIRGILYDPHTELDTTYTKHSTAGKLALEQDDWRPESALEAVEFRDVAVGPTICHDHYFSPLMGYQALTGASVLVNLSGTPFRRKKWGEILQARAIENSAYTVCTTHGTNPDGTVTRGKNAHVIAFDPSGETVTLTELATGEKRDLFNTTPNNIYTLTVDTSQSKQAKQTLHRTEDRSTITRILESTSESATLSPPRFSVRTEENSVTITYDGDTTSITEFESQTFSLADEDFYLAVVEGANILQPERLYREVLSVPGIDERRLILLNYWSQLDTQYHRNVVEPVLRARCIEWASPGLLISPEIDTAYQVWQTKNTSRMIPDEKGLYQFYLDAARGISSAFDPVNQRTDRLVQLADACAKQRSRR